MSYDGRIRCDARMLPIASASVQCIVTSPPYWGLRDYGNSDQIGHESTHREYVNAIRECALEMWRVLKPDGTFWLNLGDTYASSSGGSGGTASFQTSNMGSFMTNLHDRSALKQAGIKIKDLIGIPWRVAFALQEDGWYLRSDIIWAKPNPMPESVTDRPTRSHEYIFLFSKSERYFYDHEAIKESGKYAGPNGAGTAKTPHSQGFGRRSPQEEHERQDKQRGHSRRHDGFNDRWDKMSREEQCAVMRNKRDVWTVATNSYPEAHYATFPPKLIEPCILAGSRVGDIILDPFAGSNTTGMVAERFGRRWIACDLGYQEMQGRRLMNIQKVLV